MRGYDMEMTGTGREEAEKGGGKGMTGVDK